MADWEDWQRANPLREWRKVQRLRIKDVAQMVRVSTTTVINWESGTSWPSETNIVLISNMMKQSTAVLVMHWRKWKSSAPVINKTVATPLEEAISHILNDDSAV